MVVGTLCTWLSLGISGPKSEVGKELGCFHAEVQKQ